MRPRQSQVSSIQQRAELLRQRVAAQACLTCGCTEDRACEGGCAWRPGFWLAGLLVCDRCALELVLPLPENLANIRSHGLKRHRAQSKWRQRALTWEPLLRQYRPMVPLRHLWLTPLLIVAQKMDSGNATARLKWAEDLLVDRGYLVDDAPEYLTLEPPVQDVQSAEVRARGGRLVLQLRDAA